MFFIGKLFRRTHDAITFRQDGRAIIFLCFFVSFPASIAYDSIFYSVVSQLPQMAAMILAFRLCLIRGDKVFNDTGPTTREALAPNTQGRALLQGRW